MRQPLGFTQFRPSSFALAAALLFALGGLFAVDLSLQRSARTELSQDAKESALLVEGFLAVHAEALQSFRGLYMDTTRAVSDAEFQALVQNLVEYAPRFRRLWATDAAGIVTFQHLLMGAPADSIRAGFDIDTAAVLDVRDLARLARATGRLQISRPGPLFAGERGFVMLNPLYIGKRFVGFVVGTITSASLLGAVAQRQPRALGHLVITAGADTILLRSTRATSEGRWESAVDSLKTPSGEYWRITVAQKASEQRLRLLLWSVGLATLTALVVTLLHERRQGGRLAERSQELERLSSELLRANRAKSEFLANVSHELRTPLNAIVGFVELLRDGVYGELAPRQVGPVDRIQSSANHLRHLVDQVLDIAKMAAGRLEVHSELVDLNPFVLNVASEVEALITERGLNLSIAVSRSLPRVRTDPTHLRQILTNLLGNAVKFTPSGGIAIRARLVNHPSELGSVPPPVIERPTNPRPAMWIALQVADTGTGIALNDRERIFEEFEQVNAGPRGDSARRGTGLGLAISRRLARLLSGDLTVESDFGKGSTFTLWLPVAAAEVQAAQARTATGEMRKVAEPRGP